MCAYVCVTLSVTCVNKTLQTISLQCSILTVLLCTGSLKHNDSPQLSML